MRHNRAVTQMPQQSGVAASGGDVPTIPFSERRLENGLRVIVAPDHLAPVVAINIWYVVGSRHEQPGRTGFAHLFEHFMFQGSRHVTKAEHFSLIQSAGGVNNATTYFDRTNYFETLPSHQLELALWLEADRMATLLDALDQENLDNQRDVVKNEKRQSYDNRPYGSFYEKLMAAVFPADHPYHHTPIGSMEDLNAASVDDVVTFFKTWYAPNNAVLSIVGDVDEEEAHAAAARYFGPIPANPEIRQPDLPQVEPLIGHEAREVVPDNVPLTRVHFGFRCPPYGTREFDALEVASQILAGGRGSRLYRSLVRERKIAQDVTAFGLPLDRRCELLRRLDHRPSRQRRRYRRAGLPRRAAANGRRRRDGRRADPSPGTDRGERARRAGSRRGGRRPAVDVRGAVRSTRADQ